MDDVYNTPQGFIIPDEHIPSDVDMVRYAQGDETITNQLIEGLTGHIVTSVEWFLSTSPTAQPYSEDCLSEALLKLTTSVNKNLGQKYSPGHFVSKIRLACLGAVKDWLREMSIAVTIPKTTQHRNDVNLFQQKLTEEHLSRGTQIFDEVWFDTFMDGLDDFDQKIVRLKIADVSDREIGRTLNIGRVYVRAHLQRLALIFTGN